MRSVFAVLHGTSETEVSWCPGQRDPWLLCLSGDPCLYIHVSAYDADEHEPGEAAEFARQCGAPPAVEVTAHVSGRHPGDGEVRNFLSDLLTRFGGFALDDFTGHVWTLAEIRNNVRVEGHPFFDYRGWYESRGRTA